MNSNMDMMTEDIRDKVASLFTNVNFIQNDALYTPLSSQESATINICGVGINVALVHDPPLWVKSDHYTYINVVHSIEGKSPASKAGLQEGDIIVGVNGTNFDYGRQVYLPEDVADLIRGPEGSKVRVSMQREGKNYEYELMREPVGSSVVASSPMMPLSSSPTSSPTRSPEFQRKSPMPVTPESQRRLDSFEERLGRW
mmetsp:Transcript_27819/g.50274  ORF Transcript_27819/g.50274 Transcript_27819/m.50274 type:complete len:199 (-) Transcript_27819:136-732(-)